MRLRDAKEQIERERPELTGSAKLEAIKALRRQAAAESKPTAPTARHCGHCDQPVKPVEKRGWSNFFTWVALLQFGAVVAAIVNAISGVDPDAAGGVVGRLILWPAALHPAWVGIAAAIGGFLLCTALAGALSARAAMAGTCPKCGRPLAGPPPAG